MLFVDISWFYWLFTVFFHDFFGAKIFGPFLYLCYLNCLFHLCLRPACGLLSRILIFSRRRKFWSNWKKLRKTENTEASSSKSCCSRDLICTQIGWSPTFPTGASQSPMMILWDQLKKFSPLSVFLTVLGPHVWCHSRISDVPRSASRLPPPHNLFTMQALC